MQVRGVVEAIMAEVRAGPPVVAPELEVLRLELDLPGCFSPLCASTHAWQHRTPKLSYFICGQEECSKC